MATKNEKRSHVSTTVVNNKYAYIKIIGDASILKLVSRLTSEVMHYGDGFDAVGSEHLATVLLELTHCAESRETTCRYNVRVFDVCCCYL